MASELRQKESGTWGCRRILVRQVGKAREALGGDRPPPDESVHDARKRLKKARALLRLLRPALGARAYREENAALRDAARPLTEVRDAKVLVSTLDKLAGHLPAEVNASAVIGLRQALRGHQREVRKRVLGAGDALGPVKESLGSARGRAKGWPVGGRGWSVLGAGLKRVYRGGRAALGAAEDDPSVENLHEWRKQVKYLWHQLQVLGPVWPAVLEGLADQAHALGNLLGDDHDLAVLRAKLEDEPARFPDRDAVASVVGLIDTRRADLQGQALALGRRLYEEKPRRFAARLGGYWRSWRAESRAGSGRAPRRGVGVRQPAG